MVKLDDVLKTIDPRKNKTLRIAQAALPENQFRAFRGLFLDEFGKNGLESDLARLFAESRVKVLIPAEF